MVFLRPAQMRMIQCSRSLQQARSVDRVRCRCTENGDAAADAADENRAFKIKPSNRRQPVKKSDSASSDLINAMSELSKGRAQPSQGTKSVFGSDQMSWRVLTNERKFMQEVDQAINEYPCERVFTAIGEASPGFKENMIDCVEKALNFQVHPESIQVRQSSGSKYVSIKIGPVIVSNADEVVAVYTTMKKDERLKWFI